MAARGLGKGLDSLIPNALGEKQQQNQRQRQQREKNRRPL